MARKIRLLAIADVRGWIFQRHAEVLREGLSDEFLVDIAFRGEPFDPGRYDLVYPLEWNTLPWRMVGGHGARWVSGVRSHVSWETLPAWKIAWFLGGYDRVHAVSRELQGMLAGVFPGMEVLSHGVDLGVFSTARPPFTKPDRIVVGWAGNRATKVKGFEEFIVPLGEIPGVELRYCGLGGRNLDLQGMREFYEEIDVYVCSSLSEGSNNPLMEAAAMGRAIVTTSVGTVPEYLQDGVSALIVPRRLDAFRSAISRLRDDREFGRNLGRRASQAVVPFGWESRLEVYRSFFRRAMSAPIRSTTKRRMLAVLRALASGGPGKPRS